MQPDEISKQRDSYHKRTFIAQTLPLHQNQPKTQGSLNSPTTQTPYKRRRRDRAKANDNNRI